MHVALIGQDGVCVNVITADSVERAQVFYPEMLCVERPDEVQAGPGDQYADGVWTQAPATPMPPAPISKLTFLSRFTQAQRVAIRAARDTDAIVGDAMYMLDLADVVDTTHADTVAFVNYMAQAGFIAQADVARILG